MESSDNQLGEDKSINHNERTLKAEQRDLEIQLERIKLERQKLELELKKIEIEQKSLEVLRYISSEIKSSSFYYPPESRVNHHLSYVSLSEKAPAIAKCHAILKGVSIEAANELTKVYLARVVTSWVEDQLDNHVNKYWNNHLESMVEKFVK